jgi:regulator of replication initiation timing
METDKPPSVTPWHPEAPTTPPSVQNGNGTISNMAVFVKTGHKLLAYTNTSALLLRRIRGGRQCLQRFSKLHPLPEGTTYPEIWKQNQKIATEILETWLRSSYNNFRDSQEEETDENPEGTGEPLTSTQAPNAPYAYRHRRPRADEDMLQTLTELLRALEKHNADNKALKQAVNELVKQNTAISAQYKEIKAQYNEINAQHNEIKAQNTELRETIAKMTEREEPPQTNTNSWARVAAQGAMDGTANTTARITTTPSQTGTRAPGIDIDISGIMNPQFNTADIKTVKDRVMQAFDSHDITNGITWVGISKKTDTKYRICLRTQEEATAARIHNEWLRSHFHGARIIGDQWYPVRVDRVNKNSILQQYECPVR